MRMRATTTTAILLVLAVPSHLALEVVDDDIQDFRRVKYEALVHNVDSFSETGIRHFSEILFDVQRYQA